MKKLLLLSNSTTEGYGYLEHALKDIQDFYGQDIKKIAFLPYAGVTVSYNDYTSKVSKVFKELGYEIISVHTGNPKEIISSCDGIAVGGGNTFSLLKNIYENDLLDFIRQKVIDGLPLSGWSAGSNVACPTIRTTNDMPVVEPKSFNAFNLIDFQINPHYLDAHPDGHHGETREQRLLEFIEANPETWVVGLREGSIIKVEGDDIGLIGKKQARIFKKGKEIFELQSGQKFEFLC
jgi:dipeptidase E